MYEDGGMDYQTGEKPVRLWPWLLAMALIGGIVLLLFLGATADAAGGCGGG